MSYDKIDKETLLSPETLSPTPPERIRLATLPRSRKASAAKCCAHGAPSIRRTSARNRNAGRWRVWANTNEPSLVPIGPERKQP